MKAPHNKQIAEPKKMPADAYALIVQLRKEIARLLSENTQLREEIARLKKNSSNSSKPPSSDIVKPPRKMLADSKKHKQGAQKGHPRHNRPLLPPDQIDEHCHKEQDCCPVCGGKLQKTGRPPKVTQQIELVEKPFKVVEYLCDEYWCEHCRRYHTAKLSEVEKGLFGPKLQVLIAVMKGRGHLSYTTLQEILATVFKIKVSTGYLAKIIQGVSESLIQSYDEIRESTKTSKHLHCDETGIKENGKRRWIWLFRSKDCTLFHLAPSRGSEVLFRILGEDYSGIISCDYYGAYRKFVKLTRCALQFCWAHLIREICYISEKADCKTSRYGKRILNKIRQMFAVIRNQELMSPDKWKEALIEQKRKILRTIRINVPEDKDAQNLLKRLRGHEAEYFRFVKEPIPPTNNIAEQTIRNVVIDRRVTQGTRSDWGNRWLERFWSVLTTCKQRGRSLFDFILQSFKCYLAKSQGPSLFEP